MRGKGEKIESKTRKRDGCREINDIESQVFCGLYCSISWAKHSPWHEADAWRLLDL